jgi:hypothetical protein
MKLLILLLALAALCASAPSWDVCVWDMTKMIQFQANDVLTGVSIERHMVIKI